MLLLMLPHACMQDMMKTKAGAAIAQQRHAFMEQFLQQFKLEWEGAA